MKPLDKILTDIASRHLNIPTLETRHSDHLDFHEVAVWSVRAALQASFDAGVSAISTLCPTSTDARHTPGPWHYRDSEFDPSVWEITADFCESPLAEVPRWQDEDGNDSKEAVANRGLMTAAAEMKAALLLAQRALNTAPRFRVGETDSYRIASIVDQAIAKATAA